MTKEKATDLLYEILNEWGAPFSDVRKGDARNALTVRMPTGEQFAVTVGKVGDKEALEELRFYKNLSEIYIKLTMMEMYRRGFFSDDEYKEICARVQKEL